MEEKERLVKKNNALVIALIFVVLADIFWGVIAVKIYNSYNERSCNDNNSSIPSDDDWLSSDDDWYSDAWNN